MPNYAMEGEAIEGLKIYCKFKERPSRGLDKNTNRETVTITGNPAFATILEVWKYKKRYNDARAFTIFCEYSYLTKKMGVKI